MGFKFNKEEYKQHVQGMTAKELRDREATKYRQHVTNGWGVGVGGVLALPTLGVSLGALALSARRLHVARMKLRVVEEELDARNIHHYKRKKRDVLIPLGACTVTLAVGITIDLVCFGSGIGQTISSHVGTRAAAAGHTASTAGHTMLTSVHKVTAAAADPSSFATSLAHGVGMQLQSGGTHALPAASSVTTGHAHGAAAAAAALHSRLDLPVLTHHGVSSAVTSPAIALHQALVSQHSADGGALVAHTVEGSVAAHGSAAVQAGAAADIGTAAGIALVVAGERKAVDYSIQKMGDRLCFCFKIPGTDIQLQEFLDELPPEPCVYSSGEQVYISTAACSFCSKDVIGSFYHCCDCNGVTAKDKGHEGGQAGANKSTVSLLALRPGVGGRAQHISQCLNICEHCFIKRACGCPFREEHVLYRISAPGDRVYELLEKEAAKAARAGRE